MASQDTIQFLIGAETTVENARTRVGAAAQVDGRFEGDLAAGHLVVGSGGTVSGTAEAGTAEIIGTFRGTLSVSGQLTVRSSGDVEGDISYGALAIDAGGRLVGALSASAASDKPAKTAAPDDVHDVEPDTTSSAPADVALEPIEEPETDWTVDPDAETSEAPAPAKAPDPAPARKPSAPRGGKPAKAAPAKKAAQAKRPAASAGKPARKPAGRKTTDTI